MARARLHKAADENEPQLIPGVDEARARLAERARLGHELQARLTNVADEAQLASVRNKVRTWSEYNEELLRSLFRYPDRILRQYSSGPSIHFIGATPDPLHIRVAQEHDDLGRSLRRLDSIIQRLELFQSAAFEDRDVPAHRQTPQLAARAIHIHVERGSNVNSIVLGATVDKIESNINASRGIGGEQLAAALKAVTEACTGADELGPAQRSEALELIEFLSEQAAAPPDRRRVAVLRSAARALGAIMVGAATAGEVWNDWAPIIEQTLHLGR
jgi:hypothetical protein